MPHRTSVRPRLVAAQVFCLVAMIGSSGHADMPYPSHPPIRLNPPPTTIEQRPLPVGPSRFADPVRGSDDADGTAGKPWRTIQHALTQLGPGDTLLLRGGVYHERVHVSAVGTAEARIVIRSYPGEQAIIDGGIRDFLENAADAWQPYPDGAPGEYRSTKPHRNLRDAIGAFADSMIALQTYWHAQDLRAENELWKQSEGATDFDPVYCGPGLWYDRQSGHLHVRLRHTNLPRTVALDYPVPVDFDPTVASNYRGETDPRKLPMVIAPFDAVPLRLSGAEYVSFQDIVIRGGGYDTVVMRQASHVEFDNVTIWAGTYGLRSQGAQHIRFYRSAIHGSIPPWGFRDENGLHHYMPDPNPLLARVAERIGKFPPRNIARLNTHALLVTEGREESSVFYFPLNRYWEICHSDFTDGHDGVYLTGIGMHFHHNRVDNFHDDAMFMSTPTPYSTDDIHVHSNVFTRCLMAISMAGRLQTNGTIHVYRNIFDMRQGVNRNRPSDKNPQGILDSLNPFKTHADIEAMHIYQNTFIATGHRFAFTHRALSDLMATSPRRVFNNIFVYLREYPAYRPPGAADAGKVDAVSDYNLHWSPDVAAPADYLQRVRDSAPSKANLERHPAGWEANSKISDPRFLRFQTHPQASNDYRLADDSPAIGAGMPLPETGFPDPHRPADGKAPDLGALPHGGQPLHVGRHTEPRQ